MTITEFIEAAAHNKIIQLVVLAIVCDTVFGVLRAIKEKKFNSCAGIDGAIRKVGMLISLVFMLAILFLFYSKRGEVFSRLTLSGMAILYLALTYVVRIFWKKYLILTRANSDSRSLLIITTKDMLKTVLHNILSYIRCSV